MERLGDSQAEGEVVQKRGWNTLGLVAVTTVVGTLADHLLSSDIPILNSQTKVSWHPGFDLSVVRFSMNLQFAINWGTLVGLVVGLLLARRAK
ncbi:hypothetical protein Alches_09620 [Alicyclobacillus hesperidum subsp. aegles]|nr:hypothetical protein SD51_05820 [Alicyclobacillus tengchongensis]GLG00923.1 hypothetical protein Alches_09620 [Alicyclobacillus hesperidum subsp. aegles]